MNDSPNATSPGAGRRALRAGLRVAETALLAGGLLCLLAWAAACARATWTQSSQSDAFDRALQERLRAERLAELHAEQPNRAEWAPGRIAKYEASLAEPVEALGRLEIPAADLSVMLLEGTDETTLDRAVGRIEGTARPGERGNLGIAGHRDGYFRGLRHLAPGDAVTLTTLEGVAHYEVERIDVVDPARVEVLDPSDEPVLTLVTCYPFYFVGDAPERFIVRARQVRFEPWRRDGAHASARY